MSLSLLKLPRICFKSLAVTFLVEDFLMMSKKRLACLPFNTGVSFMSFAMVLVYQTLILYTNLLFAVVCINIPQNLTDLI